MHIVIEITNLPNVPRNRALMVVGKPRPMLVKTALCREFEKDLDSRLRIYSDKFTEFCNSFDKKEHYIKGTYKISIPSEELFTKEGAISSRSCDTDSFKNFRDVLYQHVGLDDKVERYTTFHTPVSKTGTWDYEIVLMIKKISDLYL